MKGLKHYYRPDSVDEVLDLLARPDVPSALLGGGTSLIATAPDDLQSVIDLQAAGLDHLDEKDGRLTAGATARLQDLADFIGTPALLREACYFEAPNTIRNAATLGGLIASADPESELLAALLVYEARVVIQNRQVAVESALAEFLNEKSRLLQGAIITEVRLPTGGRAASARVARTPADRPIVAAAGRVSPQGELLIALCGAAKTPLLAGPEALDRLPYPADFRGSSEYRRAMAGVLIRRVRAELGA